MKRYLNLIKIISGYFVSRISRKICHWGNPVTISIEPTNRCNLHCPECPSGTNDLTRNRGDMTFELFEKILHDLRENLFYLTLYFQGEPYLNRDFFRMVKLANEHYIFVASSTNGHYLSQDNARMTIESGLDELIISVDGTDQETYSAYRKGGSLEKVREGIRNLTEQKKILLSNSPVIILQFIVLKTNEHQMKDVRRLGLEWGADEVRIKSAQLYNFDRGNDLLPSNEIYSRYRKITEADGNYRYEIKNPLRDGCWRMWSSAVLTWEGDVVPCCYDKDANHKMGNIRETSFSQIWKGDGYSSFRKQILTSRKAVEMCRNCDQKW